MRAITNMRRVEHPWDEADAQYLFGVAQRDLGDSSAAATHFSEALAIYDRIAAAEPFRQRVLAAWPAEAREPRGPRRREVRTGERGPSGLSERELEVLRLLAGGRSNAEIADALVVSQATVATHVRHILEKTRTANRTEAVAWATRRGIV